MKTLNRLLLVAALVIVLIIVLNVKSCSWFGGTGENTMEVQRSEIDLGRLISGNKISIRDKIIVRQTGNLKVDGNYLTLGDENKDITISFISEIGYRPSDIIRSEKIDSVVNGEVVSKTLLIELPLPDTLMYVPKNVFERKKEMPWEGWYKDKINKEARQKFIRELIAESYEEMRKVHVTNNPNKTATEATKTIFNYVNNAYKIGNDKGFDAIIAFFKYTDNGATNTIQVYYDGQTLSTPEFKIENQ